jgi:hypothetical protein
MKEVMMTMTICKEVLGLKKYSHKEWITQGTLEKVAYQKRRKAEVNTIRTRAKSARAQ